MEVQVVIQGLPISAAFRYAIYTDDFIMVRAFPIVGVPPSLPPSALPATAAAALTAVDPAAIRTLRGASAGPFGTPQHGGSATLADAIEVLRTASADSGSRSSVHQDNGAQPEVSGGHMHIVAADSRPASDLTRPHDTDADSAAAMVSKESLPAIPAPIRRTGDVLLARFEDAWRRWKPLECPDMAGALRGRPGAHAWGGDGGGDEDGAQCPNSSAALNVSDAEVQADSHMATLFMNDAVPQCLLWALHRRDLLRYTVQDGDVPGVRCHPHLTTSHQPL